MNRLLITGASGHGKVVADIARLSGYEDIGFLDDDETVLCCGNIPVIGRSREAMDMNRDAFIAIGDNFIRRKLGEEYIHAGLYMPVLIHPGAVVSDDVKIGIGSVIMAGAVINPGAVIGKGVIVNTGSSIDHDCIIEDYCHISVGAHVCGTVAIGKGTWIGAGSIISNNISICKNCITGAGAVVVQDIEEPGIYVGIPARRIKAYEAGYEKDP